MVALWIAMDGDGQDHWQCHTRTVFCQGTGRTLATYTMRIVVGYKVSAPSTTWSSAPKVCLTLGP